MSISSKQSDLSDILLTQSEETKIKSAFIALTIGKIFRIDN